MNLLHLDSSILGDNSVSRKLSAEIVAKFTNAKVTYHDLAANPIPHVSLEALGALGADNDNAKLSAQLMAEFKAADTIVIGLPMYNFGIPSQLKAWIDRIAVAGQTFSYTAEGPVGLMGGKRVIIASATGGFYGAGTPTAAFNHQSVYLQHVFGFLGITDIQVITAEGVAVSPDQKQQTLTAAEANIAKLAA